MRKVGSFKSENVIFPHEFHCALSDEMIYGIMLIHLGPIHFMDLDIFQVEHFKTFLFWMVDYIVLSVMSIVDAENNLPKLLALVV